MEHITIKKENFAFNTDVKVQLLNSLKVLSFDEFANLLFWNKYLNYKDFGEAIIRIPITKDNIDFFENWLESLSYEKEAKKDVVKDIIIENNEHTCNITVMSAFPNYDIIKKNKFVEISIGYYKTNFSQEYKPDKIIQIEV